MATTRKAQVGSRDKQDRDRLERRLPLVTGNADAVFALNEVDGATVRAFRIDGRVGFLAERCGAEPAADDALCERVPGAGALCPADGSGFAPDAVVVLAPAWAEFDTEAVGAPFGRGQPLERALGGCFVGGVEDHVELHVEPGADGEFVATFFFAAEQHPRVVVEAGYDLVFNLEDLEFGSPAGKWIIHWSDCRRNRGSL